MRRESSTRRRAPLRPRRARTPALTAARKASASRTLPRLAIRLGRELRRALGDQGFRFADEGAALDRTGEDDLAAAAERVRDGPLVGDRQALAGAVTVDHPEGDPLADVANRAFNDLAGHLVTAAGAGADQFGRLFRLGRSRERGVDQRHCKQNRDAERATEPDLSLLLGIHEEFGLSQAAAWDNRCVTDDRVLLITGASSGIGAATARAAAGKYRLVLAARRLDELEELAEELGGEERAIAVRCDVTEWDEVQALATSRLDRFGRIDAVFANAGFGATRGFLEESVEHWRSMVLTNVYGVALTIRATLPHQIGRASC